MYKNHTHVTWQFVTFMAFNANILPLCKFQSKVIQFKNFFIYYPFQYLDQKFKTKFKYSSNSFMTYSLKWKWYQIWSWMVRLNGMKFKINIEMNDMVYEWMNSSNNLKLKDVILTCHVSTRISKILNQRSLVKC